MSEAALLETLATLRQLPREKGSVEFKSNRNEARRDWPLPCRSGQHGCFARK